MDPNSFDAVRVINSSKIQWRIRVRIIRMWTISNSDDMSIRINATGQVIHAYVNGEHIGKIEGNIAL